MDRGYAKAREVYRSATSVARKLPLPVTAFLTSSTLIAAVPVSIFTGVLCTSAFFVIAFAGTGIFLTQGTIVAISSFFLFWWVLGALGVASFFTFWISAAYYGLHAIRKLNA